MKKVIICILSVLLICSIAVAVYLGIDKSRVRDQLEQTKEEMQALMDEANQRLSLEKTAITVKRDITAGEEIKEEDLTVVKFMSDSEIADYVTVDSDVLGKQLKIDVKAYTPLLQSMVMFEPLEDTDREYDISVKHYPVGLKVGDYVDLRITYPYGEDYIVLSHIQIKEMNGETLKVHFNEDEQHIYRGACVDYYLTNEFGTDFYLLKYIEPGVQEAAVPYYSIPANVVEVMRKDPNVVNVAQQKLRGDIEAIKDKLITEKDKGEASKIVNGVNSAIGSINSAAGQVKSENEKADGEVEYYDYTEDADEERGVLE